MVVVVVVVVVGSSVVVSNVSLSDNPEMISVRFKSSRSVKLVPVASSILSKTAVSEELVDFTAVPFVRFGVTVTAISDVSVSELVSLMMLESSRDVLTVEEDILSVTGGRKGISPTEVSFKCISTVAFGAVVSGRTFKDFKKLC